MIDYNIDAEKSVLSAIMSDNNVLSDVDIDEEDFADAATKCTFKAMVNLYNSGSPVDILTLSESLRNAGRLESVGGLLFLSDIDRYSPTLSNVAHHAKILRELSLRRRFKQYAADIKFRAGDCEDITALIDEAQRKLLSITETSSSKTATDIGTIASEYAELLIDRQGKTNYGIMTKFTELDKLTGGFKRGNLIVLAARPAMGKTALALNIAHNIARTEPVLFVSLEMSEEQLIDRMFKTEAFKMCIFDMGVGEQYAENVNKIKASLAYLKMHIYDNSMVTVSDIRRTARRIKHQYGSLGLIVVDYLQLMRSEGKHDSRVQEVSDLTRSLKVLARELDVPMIALSQLSRGVESRQDKRPMLSDLRESGSIEQDADIVMMLYRESYYDEEANKGLTELNVNKHRAGPVGKINLFYRSTDLVFLEMAPPKEEPRREVEPEEDDDDGED